MRISDWSSDVCSSDLPELVACPRLALGDAFHLGCVQRVEFVAVARLLGEHPGDALAGDRKSGFELGVAGDLATDVAVQPAEPRAQLPHPAHCLLVAASVDQPRDVAPRAATDAQERLARPEGPTAELQSLMAI